jgi:5-methylcytosine-specific restriction endonuclease McrA
MNHIDTYRKAFNIGDQDRDSVLCEVCSSSPCQIHHVRFKSQGGTNEIKNLIALCSHCHDIAHGKVKGKELLKEYLYSIIDRRL